MTGNANRLAGLQDPIALEPEELDAATNKYSTHFIHGEAPNVHPCGQRDLPNERHRHRIVDIYPGGRLVKEGVQFAVETNIQSGECSA